MDTRVKRYGSRFRSAESVDYKREAERLLSNGDLYFCKDKQRHVLSLVEALPNPMKNWSF
jgi:hypothetical protein